MKVCTCKTISFECMSENTCFMCPTSILPLRCISSPNGVFMYTINLPQKCFFNWPVNMCVHMCMYVGEYLKKKDFILVVIFALLALSWDTFRESERWNIFVTVLSCYLCFFAALIPLLQKQHWIKLLAAHHKSRQ